MISTEHVFKKNEDVVTRKIADQLILVPIKGNVADMQRLFMLNPVAEFIWQQLDGKCSVAVICEQIANGFIVDQQNAEKDAFEFIGQLIDFQLINEV